MEFEVRRAAPKDVPGIVDLIAGYLERGVAAVVMKLIEAQILSFG